MSLTLIDDLAAIKFRRHPLLWNQILFIYSKCVLEFVPISKKSTTKSENHKTLFCTCRWERRCRFDASQHFVTMNRDEMKRNRLLIFFATFFRLLFFLKNLKLHSISAWTDEKLADFLMKRYRGKSKCFCGWTSNFRRDFWFLFSPHSVFHNISKDWRLKKK